MLQSRLSAKRLAWMAALALCLCSAVLAQELEPAVSPSPVGSGARAAGMADAFVAIADDATAASWNPAGLVQLERPEVSFVGSYNSIWEEFSAHDHDEVDSSHSDDNADLNYLSVVYPLPFTAAGRNMTVSLNYQRKYSFDRDFTLEYVYPWTIDSVIEMDFEQDGGLSTVTPAFAMEITNRLSVGAAVNLWRDSFISANGWKQTTHSEMVTEIGPTVYTTTMDKDVEYRDFSGENVTVGVLWNVTDKWSVAARYDTSFTGTARYKEVKTTTDETIPPPPVPQLPVTEVRNERRHIKFPSTIALGAAFRANDRLTVSADLTRTDWDDFYVRDAEGNRSSLVDASNLKEGHEFHATHTIRLGAEYAFIPKQPDERMDYLWTARGGLFYDQEPAKGEPDDFYGFALGCGLLAHQRVNIDLAYQLRYGHKVNSDFIRGVQGFEEDVLQHRVLVSAIVYF